MINFNCPKCGAPGHLDTAFQAQYSCYCRFDAYRPIYAPMEKGESGRIPVALHTEKRIREIVREEMDGNVPLINELRIISARLTYLEKDVEDLRANLLCLQNQRSQP